MDGRRTALIVASDEFEQAGLSRLRAPAADADALAGVLGDPDIGGFDVRIVHNSPSHTVQAHIEDLFADGRPDDLLLLHFSGHGLKSDSGELFFATPNTRPDRLASTAVSADFVQRCMRGSRARSIVLFLDCCYGGAFGEGVAVRAAGPANVLDSFPAGKLGGGRGRAVITASSAMEYAFEGSALATDNQNQPSVFTSAVVEGLSSGAADRDEDGLVSLNELYDYVFDQVRAQNPNQTPSRDIELQGELYVAKSRRKRVRPAPLPPDLRSAIHDENMYTRLGAVGELRARLASEDPGVALGAQQALQDVARSDTSYVADAARDALASAPPASPEPTQAPGSSPAPKPGTLPGPAPGPDLPRPAMATSPLPLAGTGVVPPPIPDVPSDTLEPSAPPEPSGARLGPGTPKQRFATLAGGAALVAGLLLLLGLALPQRYSDLLAVTDPHLVGAQLLASLLCLVAGALMLWLPERAPAYGLLLGNGAAGLLGALVMVLIWEERDRDGFEMGWYATLLAYLLMAGAAVLGLLAAREERGLGLRLDAYRRPRAWVPWVVLVLAVASALPMFEFFRDSRYSGWLATISGALVFLMVAVPSAATFLAPVSLRQSAVPGWTVAVQAPLMPYWDSLNEQGGGSAIWTLLALAALAAAGVLLGRPARAANPATP